MLKFHTEEELILFANEYKDMLQNTLRYRQEWNKSVKKLIIERLEELEKLSSLGLDIQTHPEVVNLESISASLGRVKSGIEEVIEEDTHKPVIKFSGMLLYQQLFNGKIKTDIFLPFIEGIHQQAPPVQLGIYRPDEISHELITEHMAQFLKMVIEWEDFDDDKRENTAIGFGRNIMEKIPAK